jgi:hypothetical protein
MSTIVDTVTKEELLEHHYETDDRYEYSLIISPGLVIKVELNPFGTEAHLWIEDKSCRIVNPTMDRLKALYDLLDR